MVFFQEQIRDQSEKDLELTSYLLYDVDLIILATFNFVVMTLYLRFNMQLAKSYSEKDKLYDSQKEEMKVMGIENNPTVTRDKTFTSAEGQPRLPTVASIVSGNTSNMQSSSISAEQSMMRLTNFKDGSSHRDGSSFGIRISYGFPQHMQKAISPEQSVEHASDGRRT